VPCQNLLDLGKEPSLIKRDLGQEQDMRRIALVLGSKCRGSGGPAGVSHHHLDREYLCRGSAHRRQVERSFPNRSRDIFRGRTESR